MSRYKISYAGLTKTTGDGSGTIIRGTSPGQFQLRIAPGNEDLVEIADLVLWEDDTEILRLVDCAFVDMEWERGTEGSTAMVTIADRRWRWVKGGGSVSGHYNVRKPDGTVEQSTAKTLQELLQLCFEELDEDVVDLSAVPNIPQAAEVRWDHTRTKDALDGLLQIYGMEVVLRRDNSVKVVVLGTPGGNLPSTAVRSRQGKMSGLAIPDIIRVVGAPTRWQMLWELEPVGLDLDGKWKAVEDLSYRPSGGWSRIDPEFMLDLDESVDEVEKKRRKLALETVYRCYRLKRPADFDHSVANSYDYLPEYEETGDGVAGRPPIEHIVLRDTLFTVRSNGDGTSTNLPAEIHGVFWATEYGAENTSPDTLWDGGFQIDAANQLVRFPKAMHKFARDNESYAFAELFLLTTFSVLNPNRAPVRYEQDRVLRPGDNRHERIFQDVELQVTVPFAWDPIDERYERGSVSSNTEDVRDIGDYYLGSIVSELSPEPGEVRPVAGFIAVDLDSELSQVSYQWSGMRAFTTVSKNTEHRTFLPYKAIREIFSQSNSAKASGKGLADSGLTQSVLKGAKGN